MKRLICLACFVVALTTAQPPLIAFGATHDALQLLAGDYEFVQTITDGDGSQRMLYIDRNNTLFVYRIDKGGFDLDWEDRNLGAAPRSMQVVDLYGDGRKQVAIATSKGRVVVYDLANYDVDWENFDVRFDEIDYMVIANIDNDPQAELIILADKNLQIYDGRNKTLEHRSQDEFTAKHMVVGNVDSDDQAEIILNTGWIVDSRFYNVEYKADSDFGDRLRLMDFNGDRIPEIFGEFADRRIRVFDVYAERELF